MNIDKYRTISENEQRAIFLLMEETIDRGMISVEEGRKLLLENKFSSDIYESLKEKEVFVEIDGNIGYIYPVSGFPTHHRVKRADGKEFYAMCAVDALGTYKTFYQNIEIESICSETGEKIQLVIEEGEIVKYSPENIHVLHVDLDKFKNWAANCWNIMNFFRGKKEMKDWVEKMGIDKKSVFYLDLREALEVGENLFGVDKKFGKL